MKKLIIILIASYFYVGSVSGQNLFKYPLIIGKQGTATGQITLTGITSGTAVIRVPAIAGTGTVLELPANNGSNGQVLTTNGSGVLSWGAGGSGKINAADSSAVAKANSYVTGKMLADAVIVGGTTDTTFLSTDLASVQPFYVIDTIGGTFNARPGRGTGLPAYSGALPTPVVQSAVTALTNGGHIYMNPGLYDNWDSLLITNNKVTIKGAGKGLTILKLKANKDLNKTNRMGMIWLGDAKNTTIKDIELDGNRLNQTNIYDPPTTYSRICAIQGAYWSVGGVDWEPDGLVIEDCYIHDASQYGIWLDVLNGGTISHCDFKDAGENNINISSKASNVSIEYCNTESTEALMGVSIALSGTNIEASHCLMHSSADSWDGGEFQGVITYRSRNLKFTDCTIIGFKTGITSGQYLYNSVISNCIIDSCSNNGIFSMLDSALFITGNRITNFDNAGIALAGAHNFNVTNNYVSSNTGNYGIILNDYTATSTHSTGNKINGNTLLGINGNGVRLYQNSTGNYIFNNILDGTGWVDLYIDPLATGNVFSKNWGIKSASWLPETGALYISYTATSDGLTTGLLTTGSQHIRVSSSSANNIISLPVISAATIGMKIRGQVQANGFELRVDPSQATTAQINHKTTNVEAAVPAYVYFEVWAYDATHWILNVWTEAGVQSAPVPDAV